MTNDQINQCSDGQSTSNLCRWVSSHLSISLPDNSELIIRKAFRRFPVEHGQSKEAWLDLHSLLMLELANPSKPLKLTPNKVLIESEFKKVVGRTVKRVQREAARSRNHVHSYQLNLIQSKTSSALTKLVHREEVKLILNRLDKEEALILYLLSADKTRAQVQMMLGLNSSNFTKIMKSIISKFEQRSSGKQTGE